MQSGDILLDPLFHITDCVVDHWDDNRTAAVLRRQWGEHATGALERAWMTERIDHRNLGSRQIN